MWEKCVGRNTGLVGAFHKHKPGLLEAYPKDRAKASEAWPSIRSWTNAAICAGALEVIDAELLLRYRAVADQRRLCKHRAQSVSAFLELAPPADHGFAAVPVLSPKSADFALESATAAVSYKPDC